jgi:ribosome-interacting GTPase 1
MHCIAVSLQDSKGGGEGFEVTKFGDGRVALIGEDMHGNM